MLPDTISVTELVWTLASIPGFWYAIRLLRRALGDVSVLRRNQINGIREYSAIITVYTYFLFTFVEFGFIVSGLAAMAAKPANPNAPVTTVSIIITVAFLMINFVLTFGCIVIEKRRNLLIEMIHEEEGKRDRRAGDTHETDVSKPAY